MDAHDSFTDMRKLGMLIGAIEHGYNPGDMDSITSSAAVWDAEGGPAARLMFKAARDLLVATGRGQSAPAYHLHFLSKSASWDVHAKEVASHVAQVIDVLGPMHKQAFNVRDVAGAGGLMGRGALLGSMMLGGGLGTLYWLLSRHSNQDAADIESMQNQVNYYNELSKELEDSMRRKYRYDRGTQPSRPGANPSAVTA